MTTPYGITALAGELDKLARAVQGTRNTTLNEVWFKLAQLADAGHLDRDHAWQQVYDTARQRGLADTEIRKTMASAEKGGTAKPRGNMPDPAQPRRPSPGHGGFLQPGASDSSTSTAADPGAELAQQQAAALPDAFWDARPYLAHIRQAAWSRGRSAEAVLAATLARVAADTPHVHKLPPVVGSRCGLSLIVALTGPSGSGKSTAKNIATELVPAQLLKHDCDDVPPGSGEGLIELLFEWVAEDDETGKKTKKQTRHNVFVFADEGEILAIQARRNTSNTILPIIRTVFTDGTLGQANASEDRRRRIGAGRYVYGIVLGIQPDKAQPLFDDAAGGTPQRFLWAPTDAPVPQPGDRPDWPGELPRPRLDYRGFAAPGGWRHFDLDPAIVDEVAARDHHRQEHGCDPLDQHLDLVRLKVAAVLAVLDGRTDIDTLDWQLAEAVVIVSVGTRARVLAALARQRSEDNRAKGQAEGVRQVIVDETRDTATTQRISKAILRKLDTAGDWVERAQLRRSLRAELRPNLDPVLDELLAHGLVEAEEFDYRSQRGVRYKSARRAE